MPIRPGFTPNGERIVFTQSAPDSDNRTESIWLMDVNGENALQLTAPLNRSTPRSSVILTSRSFFQLKKALTASALRMNIPCLKPISLLIK